MMNSVINKLMPKISSRDFRLHLLATAYRREAEAKRTFPIAIINDNLEAIFVLYEGYEIVEKDPHSLAKKVFDAAVAERPDYLICIY